MKEPRQRVLPVHTFHARRSTSLGIGLAHSKVRIPRAIYDQCHAYFRLELVELSDTAWRFRVHGEWWEATVIYTYFGLERTQQLAVQDLTAFIGTENVHNSRIDSIVKFIEQFRNIVNRWQDIYSDLAMRVF